MLQRAPWYVRWWEHQVGLMKMARFEVTLIVLQTLVTEVEAILNKRHLTYVYSQNWMTHNP